MEFRRVLFRSDLGDSFCTDSIVGAEDSTLWGNVDLNRIWALEVA